jgi:hypothetical protein
LLIANIAKTFHILPSIVAADLDNDPERLSMKCLAIINYAAAKSAYDIHEGDPKQLRHWGDIMDTVQANTFAYHKFIREKRDKEV